MQLSHSDLYLLVFPLPFFYHFPVVTEYFNTVSPHDTSKPWLSMWTVSLKAQIPRDGTGQNSPTHSIPNKPCTQTNPAEMQLSDSTRTQPQVSWTPISHHISIENPPPTPYPAPHESPVTYFTLTALHTFTVSTPGATRSCLISNIPSDGPPPWDSRGARVSQRPQ